MDRAITRRDFLHGVGALTVGAAWPARAKAGAQGQASAPRAPSAAPTGAPSRLPPPARTGLRGSGPGSFEVAHALALERRRDFGPVHDLEEEGAWDLVVVGAGVSGLAAAWFFRERHPDARILVLDNHDDFGGHARRNELRTADGRTVLGYGGSQSLENPSDYSDVSRRLLRALGVDLTELRAAYDEGFFRRHDLAMGIYFDRATYGVDRVVRGDFADASLFLPLAPGSGDPAAAVARMPIPEAARRQLLDLLTVSEDRLPDVWMLREPSFLRRISYRDLLTRHLGVTEPAALDVLQDVPASYFGVGIDAVPALDALLFGLPGLGGTGIGRFEGWIDRALRYATDPYVFHFPDGNATIARLLVRRLVPGVASGDSMADVVGAAFDYGRLDEPGAPVRLRLESTVVRVAHLGDPGRASHVDVTYVRAGRVERVRARSCVLACWNAVIPHLVPELPPAQRKALASLVKTPLVYTTVLLRQWRAWKRLGIALVHCPGSWHRQAMLDFPVSLGAQRFPDVPDRPVVVHMNRVPTRPGRGLPPRDQHKAGRYELLDTSFERIERELRTHLAGMLGGDDFDPARDVEAITVNRWPHGYAWTPNPLFDAETDEPAWVRGRRRFGRVTIANSDAGGRAYLDCAIDEAHRAVGELPD